MGYQGQHERERKRQIRSRRRILGLAAVAVGIIAVVIGFATVYFQGPEESDLEKEDKRLAAACPKEIGGIPMTTDFLPRDARARPAGKRDILYIVVHETDNQAKGADAEAHNRFIHENGQTEPLSWHYTVDDHEIYHHLPDTEPAFHAADQSREDGGNRCGIGVEMCVNEDGDFEKTLQNAAKLIAWLLKEHQLKIEDVMKHQDFSGKICPNRLITEDRWEEFLGMVRNEM